MVNNLIMVKKNSSNIYKKFYDNNGYVVIEDLVPKKHIDELLKIFSKDIINNKEILLPLMDKQKVSKPTFLNGKLQNPISDPHCIKFFDNKLKNFNDACLKVILSKEIYKTLKEIYDKKKFKLLMSMFFDQNAGTPAHQDCYYLDSLPIGNLTGAWIALEDIDERAGQFYVIPKSHKMNIPLYNDEVKNPNIYEKKIYNIIKKENLKIVTPNLKKGSVLFWNSGTIHGSLKTKNSVYTRKSLTCHFIPHDLLYLRNRYSNEIRKVKGFKYDNFYCKKIDYSKSTAKKFIKRSKKSFNKQQFT